MKRAGLLLCVILTSQCGRENIPQNLDFSHNIYKKGTFSIKLYPEYKKINEKEEGVLFSSPKGEISIMVFRENISPIKKFYALTYSTKTFTLSNCNAYLFIEKEKEGFKRLIKARLEIFPEKDDIQITIIAYELEKNYNKIMDMLGTIKLE